MGRACRASLLATLWLQETRARLLATLWLQDTICIITRRDEQRRVGEWSREIPMIALIVLEGTYRLPHYKGVSTVLERSSETSAAKCLVASRPSNDQISLDSC